MRSVSTTTLPHSATKLTADIRLKLLRQIADAIRYAHRRRVIHRALGPQSILVMKNDGDRAKAELERTKGVMQVNEATSPFDDPSKLYIQSSTGKLAFETPAQHRAESPTSPATTAMSGTGPMVSIGPMMRVAAGEVTTASAVKTRSFWKAVKLLPVTSRSSCRGQRRCTTVASRTAITVEPRRRKWSAH